MVEDPLNLGSAEAWAGDFTLLGVLLAVVPALAVCVLALALDGTTEPFVRLAPLLVTGPVIALFVGVTTGPLAFIIVQRFHDRALFTVPLGFVIGGPVSMVAGYLIARMTDPYSDRAALAGAVIAGGTGGVIAGLAWLPYLAVRMRGRSGWPVMLGMGLMSPVAMVAAVFGFSGIVQIVDLF